MQHSDDFGSRFLSVAMSVAMSAAIASVASVALVASVACGDGGAVVFSGEQGQLRVTVFAEPVPPRVGPLDLSLLVQDKTSLDVNDDYRATVTLICEADATVKAITMPLDRATATNRLFRAALLDVPVAGTWQVTLKVEGTAGSDLAKRFTFPLEIAPPQPRISDVWLWILLPLVPLLIFLIGKLRRIARELGG